MSCACMQRHRWLAHAQGMVVPLCAGVGGVIMSVGLKCRCTRQMGAGWEYASAASSRFRGKSPSLGPLSGADFTAVEHTPSRRARATATSSFGMTRWRKRAEAGATARLAMHIRELFSPLNSFPTGLVVATSEVARRAGQHAAAVRAAVHFDQGSDQDCCAICVNIRMRHRCR